MTLHTLALFFILVTNVVLGTYVDPSATSDEIGTFSVTNLAYGAIGLLALLLAVVALLWHCVVSPVIDLSWDTVIAILWIVVISALLCFFTLLLWFIT